MRLERREFLRLLGGAGAALFSGFAVSCVEPQPTPAQAPEKSRELSLGKKKLNQEIDNLPTSLIKTLLVQRIKPYYQIDYPRTINYAGVEVEIFEPRIRLATGEIANKVSGLFTAREGITSYVEPLYPLQTERIKVPYVGLLSEVEKRRLFPPQNIASDGTPFIEIIFSSSEGPFYAGFTPLIQIITPNPLLIKPEKRRTIEALERFAYIKEACSHLLFDLWTEEMAKKMQELGFRSTIEVRRRDGLPIAAEVVSSVATQINNFAGRMIAALDIASYLVAVKAAEGTELVDPQRTDENFRKAYSRMDVNLGETAQNILYNSLRWALITPEAKLLDHVGDLTRIP